jgi:hypothetical protein
VDVQATGPVTALIQTLTLTLTLAPIPILPDLSLLITIAAAITVIISVVATQNRKKQQRNRRKCQEVGQSSHPSFYSGKIMGLASFFATFLATSSIVAAGTRYHFRF